MLSGMVAGEATLDLFRKYSLGRQPSAFGTGTLAVIGSDRL